MVIADTDKMDFREQLKIRKSVLNNIFDDILVNFNDWPAPNRPENGGKYEDKFKCS